MKPVWTDHALARAYERGSTWRAFRDQIDERVEKKEWEEWFEFDEREERGLQTNIVVRAADGSAAVLRIDRFTQRKLVVVSVLTPDQYKRNSAYLWSPTAAEAMAKQRQREELRVLSGPLVHRPLARLWRRK